MVLFVCFWRDSPQCARASSFTSFLDHTQWHTTVSRTPLDEWWARRRDLYLTTHNTHNRQISMPPVGFEPTISAGKRPQTYALDRATTGTGDILWFISLKMNFSFISLKMNFSFISLKMNFSFISLKTNFSFISLKTNFYFPNECYI